MGPSYQITRRWQKVKEYFSTVFTLEDTNALPATEQLLEEGKTCLEQLVVTPGMIEAKIKGLKDNKSPGADGISPRLLKEIVDDISERDREREIYVYSTTKCSETPKGINLISRGTGATNVTMKHIIIVLQYHIINIIHYNNY